MHSYFTVGLLGISAYRKLLLWQLALVIGCAIGSYMVADIRAAFWSIVTGLLLLVAHLVFGIKLFQYRYVTHAKQIVSAAFAGWMLKFCFICVGFICIFSFIEVRYVFHLFATLVITSCVHFILLLTHRENG